MGMRETELRMPETEREGQRLRALVEDVAREAEMLANNAATMKPSRSIDPSEEQIAAACARIRAGWSEYERRKRSAWQTCAWTAPAVAFDDEEPQDSCG
jgi:hypothetical protein